MPEVDTPHMLDYLFEIGPTQGERRLSHSEIEAWQRNTGIELDAWQARALTALSLEYLISYRNASAPDAPAPWATPETAALPHAATEITRHALRALAQL